MILETEKIVGFHYLLENFKKKYWIDAVETYIKHHLGDWKKEV
jgi:hypothetical protein